jgi:hypothetical protein
VLNGRNVPNGIVAGHFTENDWAGFCNHCKGGNGEGEWRVQNERKRTERGGTNFPRRGNPQRDIEAMTLQGFYTIEIRKKKKKKGVATQTRECESYLEGA